MDMNEKRRRLAEQLAERIAELLNAEMGCDWWGAIGSQGELDFAAAIIYAELEAALLTVDLKEEKENGNE